MTAGIPALNECPENFAAFEPIYGVSRALKVFINM
jgi:hypothetical protein